MTNTEIKEADRIYFRDVEPKLRESINNKLLQTKYDKLRINGFIFGVNVENSLEHTDYKRRQLNQVIEMNLDENTSSAFIGKRYRELYNKGENPVKK